MWGVRHAVGALVVASAFVLLGCEDPAGSVPGGARPSTPPQPSGAQPEPSADTATLRVGYSRLRISLPVFVAQERGLFREHGLNVELEMYDTAQPLMQALVEDRVQVAGYTALPITLNGMLRSGTPLYFLTAMVEDEAHPVSYLLRRATSEGGDGALTTIEALRGKRVGILPTVAYRAWLGAILEAHGLSEDDVVVSPLAPMMQAEALRSGGVDALFTNDPAATAALRAGVAEPLGEVAPVPRVLGSPFVFGSFNARKDWGDAHPELLARVQAALDEAVAFVNAHPAEAREAMRPYLPARFREDVSRYPDARYLPSSEVDEALLTRAAAGALSHHIIPRAPELTGLVR